MPIAYFASGLGSVMIGFGAYKINAENKLKETLQQLNNNVQGD